MIYTVTFNPSIDYIVKVDNFKLGAVNRTTREDIYAGGKGINVSIVLSNLGYESKALGFIAGFTGEEIEKSDKFTIRKIPDTKNGITYLFSYADDGAMICFALAD